MTVAAVLVLATCVVAVSLVSDRLRQLPISAPMIAVAAGAFLGRSGVDLVDLELGGHEVLLLAEVTLALLLFSDAARIDPGGLRSVVAIPARLLGVGLPLTVGLGTLVTAALLTDLSWAEAFLVAAILTPTDAALGQAVVESPQVPERVRESLEVESGLNDGLVVPLVAVGISLVADDEVEGVGSLVAEALVEIALGVGVGLVGAVAIGRLVQISLARRWTSMASVHLAILGGLCLLVVGAGELGGNGFVAAFVGGIALRASVGQAAEEWIGLTRDLGGLGAIVAFSVFGATMVGPSLEAVTPLVLVCAVGTLTVGRMMPVAIALWGNGLERREVAFIGWFGPRGLASVLFGLLLVTEADMALADDLFAVVVVVVLASVVLHGMTAAPLSERLTHGSR